jgi:hypothetical protein
VPTATITTDYFPPELRQLSLTASEVLNTHRSDQGCCVVCPVSVAM